MAILGVSRMTIKLLEESKWHIVSLQQLVERTEEELLHIDELGQTGYREITGALQRYHELEALKTSRIQRVRGATKERVPGGDRVRLYWTRLQDVPLDR